MVLEQLFSLHTEKLTESEIISALTRYKCEVEKIKTSVFPQFLV